MPDIGEGVTEAEIVEWRVRVGDELVADQVIGSVMTDKAAVEIPSPVAGTVVALGGEVGDVLAVGAELVRLELAGEAAPGGDGAGVDREPPKDDDRERRVTPTATAAGPDSAPPPVGASGSRGGQPFEPRTPAETPPKARAAPAVRRRAREQGIALHEVPGSGPDGRVTHADLDRHLSGTRAAGRVEPVDAVDEVRVVGLRRRIARRMQLANERIPHFSYIEEVDVTLLEALREGLGGDGTRPGPLPFIVRALVRALDEFPEMNARYDDEAEIVHRHRARHVGIATRTDDGLLVPVVRHAQALDIRALAAEISRLADAARGGRATREELTGSTVTVSSLGALGGLASTPIVNHPEVAIIGVNRIAERAVVRDGQVSVRRMMNLSASFDHRVVDGYDAARFVQCIRSWLERPARLLLDPE